MIIILNSKMLSVSGMRHINEPNLDDFTGNLITSFIYADIIIYESPEGKFKVLKNRHSSRSDLTYFELTMKNKFNKKEWFFLKSNDKIKDVNCVY